MDWSKLADYYPRPDFLSSSRKRLVPQLIYKGSILHAWQKKQAVALQRSFYETLPPLPEVKPEDAEIAWFLYDLQPREGNYVLHLSQVVYTEFWAALNRITTPEAGNVQDFIDHLQLKLDERQGGNSPDAPIITDITLT